MEGSATPEVSTTRTEKAEIEFRASRANAGHVDEVASSPEVTRANRVDDLPGFPGHRVPRPGTSTGQYYVSDDQVVTQQIVCGLKEATNGQ